MTGRQARAAKRRKHQKAMIDLGYLKKGNAFVRTRDVADELRAATFRKPQR